MTRIAFFDTETTGLEDAGPHEMWEFGMVLRRDDDPTTDTEYAWQWVVDLTHADPKALEINGYHTRNQALRAGMAPGQGVAVTDAARWLIPNPVERSEAGELFVAPLTTLQIAWTIGELLDGAHVAAANVDFDVRFTKKFLQAHRIKARWDYHHVEIQSYAAGRRGLRPPWKFATLLDLYGVPLPEGAAHTALGDARGVRDLWDACLAEVLQAQDDFNRDPKALAWARGHVQRKLDRVRGFQQVAQDRGDEDVMRRWRGVGNFLQREFIGGVGCVVAAFDERSPEFAKQLDRARRPG